MMNTFINKEEQIFYLNLTLDYHTMYQIYKAYQLYYSFNKVNIPTNHTKSQVQNMKTCPTLKIFDNTKNKSIHQRQQNNLDSTKTRKNMFVLSARSINEQKVELNQQRRNFKANPNNKTKLKLYLNSALKQRQAQTQQNKPKSALISICGSNICEVDPQGLCKLGQIDKDYMDPSQRQSRVVYSTRKLSQDCSLFKEQERIQQRQLKQSIKFRQNIQLKQSIWLKYSFFDVDLKVKDNKFCEQNNYFQQSGSQQICKIQGVRKLNQIATFSGKIKLKYANQERITQSQQPCISMEQQAKHKNQQTNDNSFSIVNFTTRWAAEGDTNNLTQTSKLDQRHTMQKIDKLREIYRNYNRSSDAFHVECFQRLSLTIQQHDQSEGVNSNKKSQYLKIPQSFPSYGQNTEIMKEHAQKPNSARTIIDILKELDFNGKVLDRNPLNQLQNPSFQLQRLNRHRGSFQQINMVNNSRLSPNGARPSLNEVRLSPNEARLSLNEVRV